MKKLFKFTMVMLLALSLAGCGGKSNDEQDKKTASKDLLSGNYRIEIDVKDYGVIKVELQADEAPITVTNFVKLVKEGFYDGLTFHRIIDGFMIQGGDPKGNGTGGSDETIKGEFSSNGVENPLKHTRGAISMARSSDPDSASSQFFIMHQTTTSLDGDYAVLDYLTRLRNVQEKIADKVLIVPRVYTNKPRTTGEGYKGMVHQPDPEKQPNLLAGLVAIRKMHIHAIQTSGMTCADEMLYPENYRYLSDLLSYVAVGARSVEDQQHRLTVSGMEVPAGMKNPTSGDLAVMLNSVVAAQGGHRFIYRSWEVETTGNELTHTILRGAVNKHGEAIPNYHYEDLRLLWEKYQEKNLKNPAVIVDTNHSNSNKQYDQQVRIAKEVLHSRQVDPELHTLVKGLMIESYIEPGNQKIGCDHIYGKSITDPCLGWEESERLLYTIAEMC